MALSIAGDLSSVTVNEENGAAVEFTLDGSTYTAAPRVLATLARNGDGTWTFIRRNREIHVFDSSGQLTALKDLNGYTTTLSYSGGQLTTVTDPAGRTLTMEWTAGRIASVTDTATPPRSVRFSYSPAGDLTEVVDVGGGRWTFGYDPNHRMTTKRAAKFFGDTTTSPAPEVTNT
jgi:YD repeat-containing protein